MGVEAARLAEAVETARDALLATVASLSDAQASWKPAPDVWSVTENVEHLFLAELSGTTKIWAAREETHAGRGWIGELPNAGLPIEAIVAATWRAHEQAPAIATPHIGGPLAAWRVNLRALRTPLASLADALDDDDLSQIVFPHFISGPLDARQRLAFLRFHIDRHHAQILRLFDSAGFP